jgi:glyoxylase-like metal-dependent hydrolase (beta-lactamase superfamily II)
MIEEVRAFDGGYCRHLLALVDRRTWKVVRFPAVFLALRHRREGWIVVDTGYGGRFQVATRRFPQRFYRWVLPVTERGSVRATLAAGGIDIGEVRHLVVTHFHADHVGGLGEFAGALVHHHEDALRSLQALVAWRQVRAAFLADLVPEWLPAQARPVAERAFGAAADLPLAEHDLFGDGSVHLVLLPGHAPGQLGVKFVAPGHGPALYAADAYWRRCQIAGTVTPLRPALEVQWNKAAYLDTVARLRTVYAKGKYTLAACHDADTQEAVNQWGGGGATAR